MSEPPDGVATDLLATVAAQDRSRSRLTAQATATATNAVRDFNGWYDTAAITKWAKNLSARVETFQGRIATTTDSYLARMASQITGSHVRPIGAVKNPGLRAGITHSGAYGRVADVYRWQQSRFDQVARSIVIAAPSDLSQLAAPKLVDPMDAALARAAAIANLDTQLAFRDQSGAFMTSSRAVTGWRRIPHPELSKGGTCGLCIAASDRLYGKKEPLAIRRECECTTMPVYQSRDPGSALNRSDLDRLYADAGGTQAAKLKATRYQVDEHGELGAVLNRHGQPFRSASAAAKDANATPRSAQTPAERLMTLRKVRDAQAAALPRARDLASADPAKRGPYLGKLDARVQALSDQLAA